MPIAVPLAIGAATVASASISSSATRKAGTLAANAATQNNALQADIYAQNKGVLTPYVDRGNDAAERIAALLGLGGDEASAQEGLNGYLESTGYQFVRDQGRDAITSSRATSGMLNSGSTLKALERYGQGVGTNFFTQYLNQLFGVQGTGVGAASALAGAGNNYASNVGANNTSAANAQGNAALANASNINSAIGQGVGALGAFMGQSSYGNGGGGTNPWGVLN